MKRAISLLLIVILFVNSIAIASDYSGVYDEQLLEDELWEQFKTENNLSADIEKIETFNGTDYYFNREIYEDLDLIVYGNWESISPFYNDFKGNDTLKTDGIPYYEKDGVKGEYRYHGYTSAGEYVANDFFPRDEDSGTALENKRWNIWPWDSAAFSYDAYRKNFGSSYIPQKNQFALNYDTTGTYAKQINEGLDFDIMSATFDGVDNLGSLNVPNPALIANLDPINYVAIDNMPTSYHGGQGMMFHRSQFGDSSSGAWYQTMSIERVSGDKKIRTPIEATILDSIFEPNEDNSTVTVTVTVKGKMLDDDVWTGTEEEVDNKKSQYYHREDIDFWNFDLTDNITGETREIDGLRTTQDTSVVEFVYNITQEEYEGIVNDDNTFNINFNATAYCTLVAFEDDKVTPIVLQDSVTAAENGESGIGKEDLNPGIELNIDINAPKEILDVWTFNLSETIADSTVIADKSVLINGQVLSDADEVKFLNGTYQFPVIGNDKLYNYVIAYTTISDGDEFAGDTYYYQSYVTVYDHRPRSNAIVKNPAKVNRLVTMDFDTSITALFVKDNAGPITVSNFYITPSSEIYYGTVTNLHKELLFKTVGLYTITYDVSNNIGTRTYTFTIYIGEDYEPDIIGVIWNNNLARNDELDIYASAASLDGDDVDTLNYEIFYDSDSDGVTDTSVHSGVWGGTTTYKPDKLGFYEIVFTTQEIFGEPTIDAYVTADDRRTYTITREFFVDNLLPMTKIYTDIEYNFPQLDVVLVLDENLPTEDVNHIRSNVINYTNSFRVNSMVANIDIWDTHTYTYSKTGSTSYSSGTSYPPSSRYYNDGEYTGTVPRTSVTNNPYSVDEGSSQSQTVSKVASSNLANTITISYNSDGSVRGTNYSSGSSSVPSTYYYSSGGYTGTLTKSGATNNGDAYTYYSDGTTKTKKTYWVAHYSGTVYKTESVWVSNWVSYNSYRGYYAGTVYKDVKQNYLPVYDVESHKYIIYITKDTVSASSEIDFSSVMDVARDGKVFTISSSITKTPTGYSSTWIPYDATIDNSISSIVENIKNEQSVIHAMALLPGEAFTLQFSDVDPENDPLIITNPMQYVHDANFFDNPTGQEPGTYSSYSDTQFTSTLKGSFSNVGKYTIMRKISDEPIEDPTQGLQSNIPELDIYIHRKPIADYTLDWEFDSVLGRYDTTWVDKSYDLDFEFSDPVNKGIADRKIKYRRNGGDWINEIPDNLLPGDYDLEYVVKDTYGVWSDVETQSFTLDSAPPVQLMDADLRAYLISEFDLTSIPASELIEFFDVDSRYPYDAHLAFGIYNNSGSILTPQTTKYYNSSNDSKVGQDIAWSDTQYTIPSSLVDGNYKARVYLIADAVPSNYTFMEFDMTVFTPIDLVGKIQSLVTETPNTITATTSKYVDQLSVTVQRGTAYEATLVMNKLDDTNWSVEYTPPNTIPDGNYDYRFAASVPTSTRKYEYTTGTYELVSLNIEDVRVWGDWNHWRGQDDKISGLPLATNPHRFMSHENIHIEADIIGQPDTVTINMSNELTEMVYTTSVGHTYNHTEFGFPTVSYPLAMGTSDNYTFAQEVVLPLADWTVNYDDIRLNGPYWITITATKGATTRSVTISDIDLTGNIHDLIYFQAEQ